MKRYKKWFVLFLLTLILPALPRLSSAEIVTVTVDNMVFTVNTNTLKLVVSGSGFLDRLPTNIPYFTAIELGSGITGIGDRLFYRNSSLTAVTMTNSVAYIGEDAFYYCKKLRSVETSSDGSTSLGIPDRAVGKNAFFACEALRTVTLPNGMKTIGEKAFQGCAISSVTLPNTVEEIKDYAFYKCGALLTVNLGGRLRTIGNYAFSECKTLESINWTGCLQNISIGHCAFSKCLCLKEVCLPDTAAVVGNAAFLKCTALETVWLGKGTHTLCEGAFSGCSALKTVHLPEVLDDNGLEYIGELCFQDCSSLENFGTDAQISSTLDGSLFRLPVDLKQIGDSAFLRCTGIRHLELACASAVLGDYLFEDCTGLLTVEFCDGMKETGAHMFSGCRLLKTALFPESMQIIRTATFYDCRSLYFLTLPDSVTYIGDGAFSDCSALTQFRVPSGLKEISASMLSGCSSLRKLEIPDGITVIGTGALSHCAFESIVIPASVKSIGSEAFFSCKNLRRVVILSPDTSIPYFSETFRWCENLTDFLFAKRSSVQIEAQNEGYRVALLDGSASEGIKLPKNLGTIGEEAFAGDLSLGWYLDVPSSVTSIGARAFAETAICYFRLPPNLELDEAAFDGISPKPFMLCVSGSVSQDWVKSHKFDYLALPAN